MRPSRQTGISLSIAVVGVALGSSARQAPPTTQVSPEQAAFFETKIRPVLVENCVSCHGKDTQLAHLRLDTMAGFKKGGDSGALVVPGDPDKSLLVKAIRQTGSLKMPQGKKLSASEIANIEAWVKMGAPWSATESKTVTATLWSLKPVVKPVLPVVKNKAWVKNPIDAFVLAKLESLKQSPAAPADRRTLLRRVTYDLIGLPPTADEVDAFLADKSPGAYEKVVDRLLSSPHYGERWARNWLDVARYADTKGYVFNEDRNYYNAYTYRDWVIKAFNQDLPYDQFVTQQLAADRLPEVQNSDDKRSLAALGFLTIGRRFLNSQPDIIDDRIDVTMRGLQGFTVACARCHDHKFDPIPTQDYYSLYSVFASSEEVTAPISDKAIRDPWTEHNQHVETVQNGIRDLVVSQMKILRKVNRSSLSNEVIQLLQSIGEGAVPEGDQLTKLMKAFEPEARERLTRFGAYLDELKKKAPPTPEFAMAMKDGPHPSDGVVFKRGNPGNPGPQAPRRFLLALSKPGAEREHWDKGSGRLELAKAIASKSNPLTARVFVNRVWQGHFGAGIVRTPSDFGRQGDKPTHPELLDYLASSFMDSGWSIKKLHRMIVTSATYRQSSSVSVATYNADPDNRYLSRMNRRRLDLEEMRDAVMAATGRLDLKGIGGKSVDIWGQPFSARRAVYGTIERQNLPGIFRTFDFASPDSTSARRFTTTVPQQALFFLNSPFVVEEARLLANRAEIQNAKDDGQRVRRLYRTLFGRLPNATETAIALDYLKDDSLKPVEAPAGNWQYGFGLLDAASQRVTQFEQMRNYTEQGYHPAAQFPDPKWSYLLLNKVGGHPGRDGAHCAIRRWIAPADMVVQVRGELHHGSPEGDGVRASIVASGSGIKAQKVAHNSHVGLNVPSFSVKKGETIDFVVDPMSSDGFDSFQWVPIVRTPNGKTVWDASIEFSPPAAQALQRLALYAQALMMSNEFMFVD